MCAFVTVRLCTEAVNSNLLDFAMSDGPVNTEAQLKRVATPLVIRELQNYKPFSFGHSLLMSRDMYKHENRAIGVFTSGDDAPGKCAVET